MEGHDVSDVKPKTSLDAKIMSETIILWLHHASQFIGNFSHPRSSQWKKKKGQQRTLTGHSKGQHLHATDGIKEAVIDHSAWRVTIHKVSESQLQLNG